MHVQRVILALLLASACTPGREGVDEDAGTGDAAHCAAGNAAMGEACACDEACSPEAPRCERDRLRAPSGASYCTTDCSTGCPEGFACAEDAPRPFCARCAGAEPHVVPVGEPCLCDVDCELGPSGEASECAAGFCRVASCLIAEPTSCPDGFGCEQGPAFSTYCTECLATGDPPADEGGVCGCTAECVEGLVCRRGACRRPCEIEEQCGSLSCTHRAGEIATCQDPVLDCLADGSKRPGERCDCNADCGPGAHFCLLGAIGDVPVGRCAASCSLDAPGDCPAATRCCGAERVLSPTCLPDDVVEALGGLVRCES